MSTPPNLPTGSTQLYQQRFDALGDDDTRRGYLLYYSQTTSKLPGARVITRWNKLTAAEREVYITRTAESSNKQDSNSDGEEDSLHADLENMHNEDLSHVDENKTPKGPAIIVTSPTGDGNSNASGEAKVPDYEPSDDEVAVARVGLTEANTGRASRPSRKRDHRDVLDDETEKWQWCKTLMDSNTRFSGPEEMRTVVCLYALCDDSGIIVQRKVCKRVLCGSQQTVDHVQDEYDTSQQLALCDHCHHIQAASQEDGTLIYRLYSDYAEHGDLRELLKIYYQEENLDKQISEQFIWMVFHALADAICALNTGECGETLDEEEASGEAGKAGKGKKGKKTANKLFKGGMVHLDIKPENIFVNTAKAPYLAYPKPLLADYDVVKMIAPATNTSEGRKDWGTKGFQAPEIIVEAAHHHPVNAKTDIWSLGMVIWKMMHTTLGKEKSDQMCEDSIKASFQFADGNTFTSTDILGYDAMYSNALHQLVIDCLQINPEKRPSYDLLRKRAKTEFARSQRRLGQVQPAVNDGSDIASHLRVLCGEEPDYKLGRKFQEPLRKKRKTGAPVEEDLDG